METTMRFAAILGAIFFALISSAIAHDYTVGSIYIDHPWSRATPKGASVAGGYAVIENGGTAPDRLLGGTSAIAGRVEVHEMTMDGGIMKMRPLAGGLEIAPGKRVKLEPGGNHLMFFDLKTPPAEGKPFKATLVFERAGKVEVEFAVEGLGAKAGGDSPMHMDMKH
jgi:periplasmic copper chaperone A